MALATPRIAWINCPLFLHLVAPSQVNMAALFGLAWAWHWFVDVHLPPKLKLLSYSVLSYLARNYPQRNFTEAQGRIVSPPVTMPGKPGGQFDALAANLWICYLEKWVQLYFPSGAWLANGKVTYHRKGKSSKNKFQPHMEVEGLIHTDPAVARPLALVCGYRSLGSTCGWFQWHLMDDAPLVTSLPLKMSVPGSEPTNNVGDQVIWQNWCVHAGPMNEGH